MKDRIFELTYFSKAVKGLNDPGIKDILDEAREFNSQSNITGCLLFHKGEFVQILEGDKNAVKALYEKIENDPRHYDISLLSEGFKNHRNFEGWEMAYSDISSMKAKDIKIKYFENNLLVLSEAFHQPTKPHRMFWSKVRRLIQQDEEE